jgi:hypothetical protein
MQLNSLKSEHIWGTVSFRGGSSVVLGRKLSLTMDQAFKLLSSHFLFLVCAYQQGVSNFFVDLAADMQKNMKKGLFIVYL